MIVTTVSDAPTNYVFADGFAIGWVCLARRGMLHSECEAVDHLLLPPGARLDRRGRDGVGEVWLALTGEAVTDSGTLITAGQVVVIPPEDCATTLLARTEMRLLTVSVLGEATVSALPPRRPDLLTPVG